MFDLFEYNEIIYYLQNYSQIYKVNSKNDWIQILCPYCDDAIRKERITHGHFYLSRYFNFGQCFRCDNKTSAKKLLIDIGFENRKLLNNIFNTNLNINYSNEIKKGIYDDKNIISKHNNFQQNYKNDYKRFISYIYSRIGDIDFTKFSIYPLYINNKLCIGFNNAINEISTIRFIDNNNIKYYKLKSNVNYFFQTDPFSYSNIVICEGAFDLINLYKYSTKFNNNHTFYIALNGRSYISDISSIIIENFLIGKYIINIIFDKDIKNVENIEKQLKFKLNLLNPNIIINAFIPILSKDVSEFNYIGTISKHDHLLS